MARRKERFRVVVWGTGAVGRAVLREAMRLPEVDVVGVLVYTPAKTQADAGEIIGVPPYGVTPTMDREAVLALKPDVILYTPMDHGDYRTDDEIIELLSRGHNILTSVAYQNLAMRGPDVESAFEKACRDGNATFCASGINPGFMMERLAATATGGTTQIESIDLEEFVKCGQETAETLEAFGFGMPLPEPGVKSPTAMIAEQYERQFIYYLGDLFGTPIEELRYEVRYQAAPHDIACPAMTVKQGTVAYMRHQWTGISRNGPPIAFSVNWFIGDEMRPADALCDDFYRVTIEGRPSIRMSVELRPSATSDARTREDMPATPCFVVTAAAIMQLIPKVLDAPAGVLRIAPPSNSHWKADMRD